MTTDLLTAARAWYDAGYCIVPSRDDNSKRPFGKWKDYQTDRPSWATVEEWLTGNRYTGIGVITGKVSGNVEMIELEGPGTQASKALKKVSHLVKQYGDPEITVLWETVTNGCVETSGGGGLHMFVRVTDGDVPGNSKLAADDTGKVLAETRGEGGFVIVAPTPGRAGHAAGSAYAFIGDARPDRTPTITRDDLETIHYLITEALHSHTAAITPAPSTPTTPPATNASATATGALTPWDDYAAQTTWADILTPLGWQYAYTAPDGRDHWARPGKNPKDGTSATSFENGPLYVFTTSTTLPTGVGMSKQHVYARLHHGGDHKAAGKALANQGFGQPIAHPSLPPWVPPDIDPDTLSDEELNEARHTWVRDKLPIQDWHALWADETEEEWIVEPILAKRRLIALYSAPKVGKSLLMLEIAASIAAGRPVLGNAATLPTRTLYIDFENDPRADIRTRLESMGFTPSDLEHLCYLSFPNIAKFDTKQGAEQLLAAVTEYRCEVVIIDTVSRSVQGDENENDTWLAFYRHTGIALKRAEVAMIRLDHSGKDESKGQRGGSAKSGDVDAVWRLTKTGDALYRLVCEAHRFQVTEHIVDLERVESPHLAHKRNMDGFKDARKEILEKYAKAGVPTDGTATTRQAAQMIRDAKMSVANAANTKEALIQYCEQSINAWQVIELPA